MIRITDTLHIPEDELSFSFSRSSGPGGQHVNKVSSRVTLRFDVAGSPTLTESQKRRIRQRLPTRISRDGVLRVSCQQHRSQSANRERVVERFAALLREALARRRRRRRTAVPSAQRRKRLEDKKRRGRIKHDRRTVQLRDD